MSEHAHKYCEPVVEYWLKNYVRKNMCSLCGNSGRIDTRGTRTAAGVEVGDVHCCICPTGQVIRYHEEGGE